MNNSNAGTQQNINVNFEKPANSFKRFSMQTNNLPYSLIETEGVLDPALLRRGSLPLTRVLLLSNLDNIFDNARELYSLCRYFGTVVKVLLMRNLQKALVEFGSFLSAKSCLEFINKLYTEKLAVRATFSRYENIDPKRGNKSENSLQFNDLFISNDQENQMGLANTRIISPSNKLTISVASNSYLDPNFLHYLIIDCLNKLGIFSMNQSFELFVEGKVKAVFSMPSLREAILAVIKIDGRNVKKCFLEATFCS